MGREERGVNGMKWVALWPKREELLRNGFRGQIRLPMSDYDRYWARRVVVKLAVQAAKRMAMGRAIGE